MAKRTNPDDPIIIKKYANRRLYNTDSSAYITLDDLAAMVRDNVEFQVIDAKTGEDITHSILTQIIVEEEASGEQMLPVSFLRDLIGMYGNSMQAMMPSYLEASMAAFRKNREEIQTAWATGMGANPLAAMAEANLKMMQNAAAAFMPGGTPAPSAGQTPDADKTDIDALRQQMAAMQKKLDELGK